MKNENPHSLTPEQLAIGGQIIVMTVFGLPYIIITVLWFLYEIVHLVSKDYASFSLTNTSVFERATIFIIPPIVAILVSSRTKFRRSRGELPANASAFSASKRAISIYIALLIVSGFTI